MANTISFDKAIEIALEQHRAGQFARAEGLYLEILRQDPGNVDALHLLGVLAHQGGAHDTSVQLISAAIAKKNDAPIFHYNLAEALRALDRIDEAIIEYRYAVDLNPNYFEALNNLGMTLNIARRFAEAEGFCRRAAAVEPDTSAPLNNLGNTLRGLNRKEEAVEVLKQAIEREPNSTDAVNNLAMCYCSMGRIDEGFNSFKDAIRLSPTDPDLHNNLGTTLVHIGRHSEAAAAFQTAIDLSPKHVEATNNLGAVLKTIGRPDLAIDLFKKAIELKPDFVSAYSNLAGALSDVGQKKEALEAVDNALSRRPRLSKERFMRGILLRELNRYDEAVEELEHCIEIDPANVGARTSLGYAYLERGELDAAMTALTKSVELAPDAQTHSNVLMTASYHPGYSPADILAVHQSWAKLHELPHRSKWKPHDNDRDPDRKLRIGYVSPDFRGHSVASFLEPVLEFHDHEQFEIFGYAHMSNTDVHTWRLRARVDQWRETSNLNPDQVAAQIREDKIDILVELAGHTANNALTTFARKPAPVQINMIGFPSTTGLTSMDYRVTDALCDPPGMTDEFNTETLIRLPHVFWCYQPPHSSPDVGPLPADAAEGRLTFASVNNFTKVTPQVQNLWAQLLLAVPNSRLILQASALSSQRTCDLVLERFKRMGVEPGRIEFRTTTDFGTFLRFLNEEVDITLDPFPFNGGTTTCHSLWMGVPVITLTGDRHASRMSLSMLTAIGLPEFIGADEAGYVDVGRRIAADLPHLRAVRAGMRDRLKASPLLDGAGYTRDLEAAYRKVWADWCATATRHAEVSV